MRPQKDQSAPSIIVLLVLLQFAHVPFDKYGGDVFDFCQMFSELVLVWLVYTHVHFSKLREKRCFFALGVWLFVSFALNASNAPVEAFAVADTILVAYAARQLLYRPVYRENDDLNDTDVFFLLSPPHEIVGLCLSTAWLPFGNRMVVHNGSIYYINKWFFVKRPFKESHLNGRILLNSGMGYDKRLDELTGKLAFPLVRDCREYEKIFGSIKKLLGK